MRDMRQGAVRRIVISRASIRCVTGAYRGARGIREKTKPSYEGVYEDQSSGYHLRSVGPKQERKSAQPK
jgi:hypothetical protein